MAGRGPAPKDSSQRRRRNSEPEMQLVESDGKTHGPDLPESIDWPDVTLEWWETWRTCAQASTYTDTDWSFLLDTAVLHAAFWDGNHSAAAELRLRVAKFGATPEDRARLKISIGEPKAKTPRAPRTKTKAETARRGRLLQAVADDGGA